jgi:hypothetical protein
MGSGEGVFFFFLGGGEKSPKGDTDPNFWRKPLFFFSKNESPNFAQFLCFWGACRQRPNLVFEKKQGIFALNPNAPPPQNSEMKYGLKYEVDMLKKSS